MPGDLNVQLQVEGTAHVINSCLDTGCDVTCLSRSFVDKLGVEAVGQSVGSVLLRGALNRGVTAAPLYRVGFSLAAVPGSERAVKLLVAVPDYLSEGVDALLSYNDFALLSAGVGSKTNDSVPVDVAADQLTGCDSVV